LCLHLSVEKPKENCEYASSVITSEQKRAYCYITPFCQKKKTPVTSFSQNGQTYAQWSAVVAQNLILTPYCEQETSSNRIAVSGRRGRGAQLEKERCIYIFLARMYPKFYMESFYAQQIIVFITNNSTCVFPGPIVRLSYQAMTNLTSDITM